MSVAATIEAFLERAEIAYKRVDADTLAVQLRGERKLTIPVMISVAREHVRFESFFMRRPIDNVDRFFDLLLRRNMRAHGVHFALDADGDVFLVGHHPLAALDDESLDRILGSILVEADGLFDVAIEIGFESYLAADRRWRALGNT